jgi:hypothetical protein
MVDVVVARMGLGPGVRWHVDTAQGVMPMRTGLPRDDEFRRNLEGVLVHHLLQVLLLNSTCRLAHELLLSLPEDPSVFELEEVVFAAVTLALAR